MTSLARSTALLKSKESFSGTGSRERTALVSLFGSHDLDPYPAEEMLAEIASKSEGLAPEAILRAGLAAAGYASAPWAPALAASLLSVRDKDLFSSSFPSLIKSGLSLSAFITIMRSGVAGRKSLGSLPRRKVREWLAVRSEEQLWREDFDIECDLAAIVRMVHPNPATLTREAFYGYLLGRETDPKLLPPCLHAPSAG